MKKTISSLLCILLLTPLCSIAAKDPIKWSLNRVFQDPLFVSRTYDITYTLTNQLPLPLRKPLVITKTASPMSEFSYNDNCSGLRLNPGQSCTVVVSITPLINGQKFFQLTIGGYDNNLVKLPELTTIAVGTQVNSVQGSTTQWLPYQMNLGNSANYTFTFTNYGFTEATNVVSTVTQSNGVAATITANTCMPNGDPGTLTPANTNGSSCYISGSYNASVLNAQSVTATLTFNGAAGSPASTSTPTTVISSTNPGDINATLITPYYLPPLMTENTAYPVKFLFTNVSSHQVNFSGSNVGSISCIDNNTSTSCGSCNSAGCSVGSLITTFTSNCTNDLPYNVPAAACELTATFTSPNATTPNPSNYTITASVPYLGSTYSPATVTTTGTVVNTLPITRTITVVNQCNFPVWFSLHGASVAGSCSTTTGDGCSPGTSCDQTTGTCFWTNPTTQNGTYELTSGGGTNSVIIPAYNYAGVQWSGNISASTGCNGSTSCLQASCDNAGGSTPCAPGQGFQQPATQAEFTLNASSSDSYDVEVINGYHIPISVQPFYYTGIPAIADNYTCGSPGAYTAQNNFGACNWDGVVLPTPVGGTGKSSGYYWVDSDGQSCDISSSAAQCTNSQHVCGIAINRDKNTFLPVCGSFLGYWTGDEICAYSGLPQSIDTFFNCSTSITSSPINSTLPFPNNSTLFELMKCHVPNKDPFPTFNSCYNPYPNSSTSEIQTCCGCVDWWDTSIGSGANAATQSCNGQTDPVWTTYIQSTVQWLKAACPSSYTYPFDDKSSGFSCTNNLTNAPNSTDYLVTFCDGGSYGIPPGIANGR